MLLSHPELEDQCPWGKLGSNAWHDILLEHPEFIRHAPKKITLSFMSANQWLEVLIRHPELDAYVPASKSLFNRGSEAIGRLWGALLARHPQFAKYAPWKWLRSGDWKRVLCQQPQFIDNYVYDRSQKNAWAFTLSLNDQADVIACQPSLFHRFNTHEFQGSAWETVLVNQPQFRGKCDLDAIGAYYLGRILERHPEWLACCNPDLKSPEDILHIAESFPEILQHYDLERFREIGGGDTPWIEKYPCLVPYSRWDFSYSYWNALLNRLSTWVKTGKRERVNAFATDAGQSKGKVPLTVRMRGSNNLTLLRPQPDNLKEKNLRNSLDSILECRYWVGLGGPIELMEVIPPQIRRILKDANLTYEQLMIKMSMMSEEECGMVFYGLVIADPHEFLDKMLLEDMNQVIKLVPAQVLLPLSIQYASANILYSLLSDLPRAVADFRDKAGNNAWHYFFFRNPLFNPSQEDPDLSLESDIYQFLLKYGCSPDTPNAMGFSYRQIHEAMGKYLTEK